MSSLAANLRFFLSDAWDELRHSPGVNLLAVGTLVAVLFASGLVILIWTNVDSWVQQLRAEVRVDLYLEDNIDVVDPTLREGIAADLQLVEGVERVEYVDKTMALARYSEWAGETAMLVDSLEQNPLPASFEIFLLPGPTADAAGSSIVAGFSERPGVEQVRFDREWLGRIEAFLNLARVGGGLLGLFILGAVIFVMASVLRLAVYARRDEIEIMLLVGATPSFVRGPFVVAGIAQGLLSGLTAVALVEVARRLALSYAGGDAIAIVPLALARTLPLQMALTMIAVGLAVSCTAAWFAVRHSQGLRQFEE